mgnify:CR=1 FL=1
MTDQRDNQADSIDTYAERRRQYQAVRAPVGLETRIKAQARDLPQGRGWVNAWRPITAGLALMLGLVAVSPLLLNDNTEVATGTPPLPSLTALSRSMPSKPTASMPSFSQLKSLSAPKLPSRPNPAEAAPQSRDPRLLNEFLFAYVEEKHDENA